MTGKRFSVIEGECDVYDENYHNIVCRTDFKEDAINVCKLLNALNDENEQLKSDNFNLNKSVECLDKIVKEQCNKIAWADECGVRWDEEYNEWIR